MTTTTPPTDEYDSPWKDAITHAFEEFMLFYFAQAHAQIDWTCGYTFEDTELRKVVRDAELGKRHADVLVQVTQHGGQPCLLYIHIEVQGQHDPQFELRMFTYNYRLFDRYACPIVSLAVLADDDAAWRPDHYEFTAMGCRHRLDFPVVKLLDYEAQVAQFETGQEHNPFALVTAAHLRTRQTKHNPESRYQAKRTLVRLLYQHGWSRQRVLDFFAVLDWMMRLPDGLEQELWQYVQEIEGESQMQYVTSVERLAIQRGIQQGMQQGMQQGIQQGKLEGKSEGKAELLQRQLTKRFGPLSPDTAQRLNTATTEQLELWADRVLDAPTLDAVFTEH